MDKKTCMILLLGFIFVVILSNYTNPLEGLANYNYVAQKMSTNIIPMEQTLTNRSNNMNLNPGLHSNNQVINNYKTTQSKINDISKNMPSLSKTINQIDGVNNANTASIISKNDLLQDKQYTTNSYLKNIDVSMEKVKDSEVMFTAFSYDSVIWGIIAIGLFIACLTMIM